MDVLSIWLEYLRFSCHWLDSFLPGPDSGPQIVETLEGDSNLQISARGQNLDLIDNQESPPARELNGPDRFHAFSLCDDGSLPVRF